MYVAEGDVGEVDEAEVDEANARQGSWCHHCPDDPKITCSDEAATIIAELASAHYNSIIHSPLSWLQDIANHVQTPCMEDESLISVVVRCQGIISKDICANFLVMMNYMMLVCKCQRYVFYPYFAPTYLKNYFDSICLKTGLHLKAIYDQEIKRHSSVRKIAYRTFVDWHSIGSKFIAITSSSSIYTLVLIAGLGLRVPIASMVGTMHLNIANLLRSPPKSKLFFRL